MADPKEPEIPAIIPQARSDKFSTVTTVGNKCALALKDVLKADTETVIKTIRQVMPELLQTTVSVTFEKAKIWSLIESDPNLAFYTNMDYDSWINPGDLNRSELEKAKVNQLIILKGNQIMTVV